MKINVVFKKMKSVFKKVFSSNKKTTILALSLCAVVVLIFFSSLFSSTKKSSSSIKTQTETGTVSDYSSLIESKIEEMIFSTGKVKNVSAFVMIESTPEIKYLTETDETIVSNDSGSSTTTKAVTVVFQKDGSVSTPVVVATILPKITGVMIVVSKLDASTKLSIQNALSVVLNIDETCISILQES